nr:unnamed protein product [Spirometra erinaceieuropaei]
MSSSGSETGGTKAIPGADGWTDHRLVISKMRIRPQPRRKPQVQSTTLAILGCASRQHQDWFDDSNAAISSRLEEKNSLHKAYVTRPTDDNRAAFCRSRRLLQQRLREAQDAWTARKAKDIQGYAERKEWKNVFVATKVLYDPSIKATAPFLSADGSTLLTEKTQILQQWIMQFRGVLNRLSTIFNAAIAVRLNWRPTPTSTSVLSLRNRQGRTAALQRESGWIGRDTR